MFTFVIGPARADDPARTKAKDTIWSFDTDKPDKPPTGFGFGRTGSGKTGKWVVLAAKDAPRAPIGLMLEGNRSLAKSSSFAIDCEPRP
jgi:hypothetical protein